MRVLVVAPFPPSPAATHGGAVYLGCLLAALAARVDVDLVAFATPSEAAQPPPMPAGLGDLRIVVRRARADLHGLAAWTDRLRHGIRFACGTPLQVSKFRSRAMTRVLRDAVRTRRPDACLVEMGWMAQYLPAVAPAPTILTDHEAGVPAAGPTGAARPRDRRLWERHLRVAYARADRVQALTREDADALSQRLGRPVGVRPPAVPWPERAVEPGEAPPRLVFLGDYRHPPNPGAARFVAREVWPLVRREVPDAELWLAGAHAGEAGVDALGAIDGVRVVGHAPDLRALLGAARALLAPVFEGGGSRIKVLTALAHGLPVIANDLGLRGVDAGAPAVARAGDPAGLAAACVTWLRDPVRAAEAGAAARAWAEQNASPDAAATAQLDAVRELLAHPRGH